MTGRFIRRLLTLAAGASAALSALTLLLWAADFRVYHHVAWTWGSRAAFVEPWRGVYVTAQADPLGEARAKERQVEGFAGGPVYFTPRLMLDAHANGKPPAADWRAAGAYGRRGSLAPDAPHATYRLVFVPWWHLSALFAVPPALAARPLVRRWRGRRRAARGLCPACGYDLRATPGRCPECGAVPAAGKGAA